MNEAVRTKDNVVGFWFCNVAFILERFSFYSIRWLIAVFMVAKIAEGGLGLGDGEAAIIGSNLVAFTYLAPIFGSIISDRWVGARYLIPIGMALMGIGYFIGYTANSAMGINLMIAIVSIGTGLFKPQTNSITGRLFDDKDKLDAAFSTQYSMVNVGSFLGTTTIGIISGIYGYRVCFLICATIMLVNAIIFVIGWRYLGEAGKKPFKFDETAVKTVENVSVENKPLTSLEKKRVAAIVLVSVFSAVFWIFWYLAYLPVYYYWGDEEVIRMVWAIGSFKIPTAFFDSENALLCIVLGPILGILWTKLRNRPQGGFSIFKHTALGTMILGSGFIVFALADITRGGQPASIFWIILFGILLTLGEMVFSPLGNSFISKYAPAKLLSAMMAVWAFAIFIAGKSYGYIYDLIKAPEIFATVYFVIAAILIVAGAVLLVFDKKLSALVSGE